MSALSIGVPYRTPPPCKTKHLPNGAPVVRLRFLAQRLHDLGPRPLHGFLEEILKGADLVTTLERHAAIDPRIVDALMILHGRYCYGACQRHLAFGPNP